MTQIQVRRDTSTNWTTNNPTPAAGEPCYETDTGKLKIGNGNTPYNSLPYIGNNSSGGTTDYTDLTNKPQINSIELTGNKTSTDLGLASASEVEELGNELNQLAGVVETKEDNVTALSPLTLEQKTSSTGSVGFTVSESNTLMPSSDAISLSYDINSSSTIASEFNNYIVIPYSYLEKTVVRFPCNNNLTSTNNYTTSVFLGYLEGTTVQPLVYVPISSNTNNSHTKYAYTTNVDNPEATIGTRNNNTAGSYNADGLIEGKFYSYLTTYYSPRWTQYALTSYSKNGETGGKDIICFQRYNFDTEQEKAAIEKANCVVISYGVSLNQFPIDLNLCGKFPYKGDYATGAAIPYDAPLDDVADLTDNILEFTTVTTNELALNIDNSTIKVNDNGQLYADVDTSLPTTVVTTDTAQTITGAKQFTKIYAVPSELGSTEINTNKLNVGSNITLGSSYYSSTNSISRNVVNINFKGTNQTYSVLSLWNSLKTITLGDEDFQLELIGSSIVNGNNQAFINTGNFTTLAPTGNLKYWTGTETEYTAITTKDADTLYRLTDTNKVYLGTIQLGGQV